MSENAKLALALLGMLAVIASIVFVIWARAAAPCSWVDWLPVTEVPARCLTVAK